MRVIAVIPAFDEAATIEEVVGRVRRAGLEVIVVDDGSRDETARLAERAGARVIRHEANRGKGAALRTGFAHARALGAEAALALDADLQHDPAEAPRFIEAAERTGADIVCGTRMARRSGMPLVRWATNGWMSVLLSMVAGIRLTDSQCGYRLLGRRSLEQLEIRAERFDVESDMLLQAAALGLRVREILVRTIYVPERRSRIRPLRDTIRFFGLLGRHLVRPVTKKGKL